MANIHESGKKVGKYLKENSDAIVLFVGTSIAIGSVIDSAQNDALNREYAQVVQIRRELSELYPVRLSCVTTGSGFSQFTTCTDVVDGNYPLEEKERLIREYNQEMNIRASNVSRDSNAHSRGLRDAFGSLIGLAIGAAGLGSIMGRKTGRRESKNKARE